MEKETGQEHAGPEALQSCRFKDGFVAIGRAINMLRQVQPYASYKFGEFAGTLAGQIERGHYLFAVRDQQLVGYIGWALSDEAVARAWVEGRYVPSMEECKDGDYFVLMTMHASTQGVAFFLTRECRKIYPNRRVIFTRDYADQRPRRVGTVFSRTVQQDDGP